MVSFVIVAVPIAIFNEVFSVAALHPLGGADYLKSFEPNQLNTFVMVLLKMHEYGIIIVGIFWGLWLFPFGYLVIKSGFMPKFLGIQGAHHGSFTGRFAEGGAEPIAGVARLAPLFPRMGRRLNALSETQAGTAGDQNAIFDWVKQATTVFWNAYQKNILEVKSWLESDFIKQSSRQAAKLERR